MYTVHHVRDAMEGLSAMGDKFDMATFGGEPKTKSRLECRHRI